MRSKLIIVFVVFCIAYAMANQSNILKALVIGDITVGKGVYGFIVSVQYRRDHICGGAIYGKRTIITAASCIKGQSVETISIFAGETKLDEKSQIAKRFTIDKIIYYDEIFDDMKNS